MIGTTSGWSPKLNGKKIGASSSHPYPHLQLQDYFIVALGMEEVHGPPDVIKGIPLNVATPISSVKRFCITKHTTQHYI